MNKRHFVLAVAAFVLISATGLQATVSGPFGPGNSRGTSIPLTAAENGRLTVDPTNGTPGKMGIGKNPRRPTYFLDGAMKFSYVKNGSGILLQQDQVVKILPNGRPRIKHAQLKIVFGKNYFQSGLNRRQRAYTSEWTQFSVPATQSKLNCDIFGSSTEEDVGVVDARTTDVCDSFTYSQGFSCVNQVTTCESDPFNPGGFQNCITTGDWIETVCTTNRLQDFAYKYHHYIEHFQVDFVKNSSDGASIHLGTFTGDYDNDQVVPASKVPLNQCGDSGTEDAGCTYNYYGSC
jgi:hypothetical protein